MFSRASARLGLPVFLPFIALGMLAGSEGIGGVPFEDYHLAFRLGTVALVLILFDGGLNTPFSALRRALPAAGLLATVGVAGTAALLALGARLLGFTWPEALLLAAVVCSTDAAAVFSVLRGSGLQLRKRVAVTLELESGLNDPMAVILTTALTETLVRGDAPGAWLPAAVALQLVLGAASGVALGFGARWLLARTRLPAGGLYPVLTIALALVAFGLPSLIYGSGFLAVYVAALVLGNGKLPYRTGLLRFHDSAAWLAQVGMFLLLGLLVFPSRLVEVAAPGLVLGLLLAVVARPLATFLCVLPFRYSWRETLFVAWVGLRGAVPIILATFPVLSGVRGAERLFDIVFFVVVVSALVPGGTVGWTMRRLRLAAPEAPPPQAALEISSARPLDGEVASYYVDRALAVCDAAVADLPIPSGASVLLVVRGPELIAARGETVLREGDHVHVFFRDEDRPLVELLFGRPAE